MKLSELKDLIIAISGLISAIGVPLIAVLQYANKQAIREVHLSLNSRLDQLVKSKSELARTEGHAAGMAAEKSISNKP